MQRTPWSAIPMTQRHPGRPGQQSQRHSAAQTRPCSAILVSNPKDTAPPRRGPGQQLSRHGGATQTTPWSATPWSAIPKTRRAIPMAQRHPHNTPTSNPHGTAAATRHAHQQSPWHSATHATRAISMAQRQYLRRRPGQQSPRHGATHATRPAAILMAQRHLRDTPSSSPQYGTAPHTRHAHQQSSWHSAAHTTHAARVTRPTPRPNANPHGRKLTTHPRLDRDPAATTPRRQTANEANTGPAPRPPDSDYKREPFATRSGKRQNWHYSSPFRCHSASGGRPTGPRALGEAVEAPGRSGSLPCLPETSKSL